MTDILKYIELGTNAKEYFNYDGNPLPIRPLSSYEMDEIFLTVMKEGITQSIFQQIVEIKLGLGDLKTQINLDQEKYAEFFKFYNEVDYWMVYHSMKDFQPEEFSMPDFSEEFSFVKDWKPSYPKGYYIVKQMKYVHSIAKDIKNMTVQPNVKLIEVLRNNEGKSLATRVFTLHTPLRNEAWKLTPLQTSFLVYARPGAPVLLKDETELPGIKGGTMAEVMEQLKHYGL